MPPRNPQNPSRASSSSERVHRLVVILSLAASVLSLHAQDLATRLAGTDYHLSPDDAGALAIDADVLAFFKDNEFEGELATGYTLPGFWAQPRLSYQPLEGVRIEAGFHAHVFNGANKFPCFAYHDIARWKGYQYQSGAHLLPFLRAQAQIGSVNLVLGNIYGGANHGVVEPLMNAEVNLTQDPEAGFQILVDRPRYHLDAWINWQSFIFRTDDHREAFTVGILQRIALNGPQSRLAFYLPIDILLQHRGGEINEADMGTIETLDNGAIGLGLRWNAGGHVFNGLTAEALALACWQQVGQQWPFDNGFGGALTLSGDLLSELRVFATTVWARNFCPLYGSPFFSTFSTETGRDFSHIFTTHVGAEWSHTFAPGYVVGAKLDTYLCSAGDEGLTNNFAFGLFLRCSPHFLLSKK